MKRLSATLSAFALLACSSCAVGDRVAKDQIAAASVDGPSRSEKPNIVILFADDLGYGGLGVQGDTEAVTPHIDALAAGGVRLTDYYANHPVCSPSRAALLTGVYQHRMGFEFNSGSPQNTSPKFGIAQDTPTLPERLRSAGYATGAFGKWHVGFSPATVPQARGFEQFYGFLSGAHPFTPEGADGRRGAGGGNEAGRTQILRGTMPAPMPTHTTAAFAEEAVSFIKANRDRPFFVYLPFNAVHAPMDTTSAYLAKFAHVKDTTRRTHLAMLAAMDDAVGRVMQTLREEGLEEETLVFFASDNGGPTQQTTSSNGPLNGVKGLVLEGGIRVPAIVRWKGTLPEGRVSSTLSMGFDITATSLSAAGVMPQTGLDGVDLLPYLTGARQGDAHQALYWRAGPQGAIRSGSWKAIKNGAVWHLFDLSTDLGERKDLATNQSRRLEQMKTSWTTWSGQMKDPLWVRNELAGGDPGGNRTSVEAIERFIKGETPPVAGGD